MDIENPVTVINPTGNSKWLLVCEHASQTIPDYLNQLGLDEAQINRHIGYDIGAYDMTLALSEKLNATAIVCNYSRLVIDCNRTLTAPDCIPLSSDGTVIPGNIHISHEEKTNRIKKIYQPFHRCVSNTLVDKLLNNPKTKLANIHSFTPMLSEEGVPRPWDIGFIYRHPHPTQEIINALIAQTDYIVGDNEPYNGFIHKGYTLPAHADAQDIPSFLVEFKQDLIAEKSGVEHWANVLLRALKEVG